MLTTAFTSASLAAWTKIAVVVTNPPGAIGWQKYEERSAHSRHGRTDDVEVEQVTDRDLGSGRGEPTGPLVSAVDESLRPMSAAEQTVPSARRSFRFHQ